MMDLWARIAPRSWHDRKPWRDSDAIAALDVAVALASDVPGVEAAERAVTSLRSALAAWETHIGPRIRWRAIDREEECVVALLARPLVTAEATLLGTHAEATIHQRGERTKHAVHEAVRARLPARPLLADSLAHAACVESIFRAASADRPNPASALRDLWMTGYALTEADESGVTLEVPLM
jgi:prophage DNA circulation protein